MKTYLPSAILLIGLIFAAGCSSKDSTENANKINEERIDKQAVAVGSDAKEEAKDVTKYMVMLANTSLTEYEFSKVALKKATNPEVRALAQSTMNDHQQDDRQLQTLAKQMNVTLPTTLSNKSKNHLGKLTGMTAGTEFDIQYLDYMASTNDDAIDVADDLKDSAPTDAAKTFAKKILEDDKKHKERARELKNVLN
ncbi:DUF4142 domain-containing protein [Spirosoma sp. BT702]|uniref:DUF4142 domain-containing protein n=1 Tax=Spirosoma profusum TaxID=2771354 RepID=A0A926XXY3_9BACT|nr:DUF4142 domain-containing protein [Spirosoma profusum]MBD2702979.1 DUF4142 domain-containing protein [Spirosoma profusum]